MNSLQFVMVISKIYTIHKGRSKIEYLVLDKMYSYYKFIRKILKQYFEYCLINKDNILIARNVMYP